MKTGASKSSAPPAGRAGAIAQSSHELFHQLEASGWEHESRELCKHAYDLAAELSTATYRPSGKTFLAHLIGTASVLAWLRAPAELVAAGLLHSAYTHGDFGSPLSSDDPGPRREVERRLGPRVARYLELYLELPWTRDSRTDLLERMEELAEEDREVLLLRLANELEDWLDREVAWSGNAKGRGKGMAKDAPVLIEMADRLGYPALAAALGEALATHQAAEIPDRLLRRRQPVTVIASLSWKEGGRTVSHPRSADLLSDEEVQFFKENGYLVRPGLLEPVGMRRAVDYAWSRMPPGFDRQDPTTWHGAVEGHQGPVDLAESNGRVKLRGETRTEPFLLELLPRHPPVYRIAEQLLGYGRLRPPTTVRGLYPTFPDPDPESGETEGHVDRHPFSLGVVGYLEDVESHGGGTTVWPGSHLQLHRQFRSLAEYDPLDTFEETLSRLRQDAGLELTGRAGDVVFWHPRLLHGAGRNRLARVRQAILCDFRRNDIDEIQGAPVPADVWEYWAI